MLNDNDGVAAVAEVAQGGQQSADLGRVHAARRLVEQDGERRQIAAQQAGQLDALRLAGRQRGGHPVKMQVAQPDLQQKAQSPPAVARQAPIGVWAAATAGSAPTSSANCESGILLS